RDAEMERALRELASPILAAAGQPAGSIRIFVIRDSSLNAFVRDSRSIFIHSGLLLRMNRPEMLQAVIAHEVAHIANGHLTRRPANARAARNKAIAGTIAGALVATQNPQAGAGIAVGSQSTAQRVFFSHTRAEEAAADQSGIRFMAQAGVDPQAMVEVMELFRGQEALSQGRQDPYVRTHPLSRDRIRGIRGFVAGFSGNVKEDPRSAYWYARVQGKLSAYLRKPSYTLRRTKKSDTSDAARVARAWAHHKNSNTKKALAEVDALIRTRPKDPYAHELRGQILLESRNFGASVNAYRRATELAPREALIRAGYGQALLAAGEVRAAVPVLERARDKDPFNPRLLRDLGVAYAKMGRNGEASLATAERYMLIGQAKNAGTHAKRAVGLLPQGSTAWRRAQDILDAAEVATKRKRK
ncbi:MAG: M48 family metalloprotease, partial [Pseudomonadota bacterium]